MGFELVVKSLVPGVRINLKELFELERLTFNKSIDTHFSINFEGIRIILWYIEHIYSSQTQIVRFKNKDKREIINWIKSKPRRMKIKWLRQIVDIFETEDMYLIETG